MDKPELKVNEYIKVHVPGATPWAEILEITNEGFIGRIANKLFHEWSEFEQAKMLKNWFGNVEKLPKLNDYKQDDYVLFVWKNFKGGSEEEIYWNWEATGKPIPRNEIG